MGIKKTTLALAISTVLTSMASADITGVVYKDFDLNGAKNGGDIGIEGIALTATCEDGTTSSATTNALGQYTIAVANQGDKCRVEADPSSADLGASANAGGSSSLVSIVSDGSTHNITVASPASYCQASPDVAMVALPGGTAHNPTSHGSLYTLPTPPVGTFDNDEQNRVQKAIGADTGAIWGLAWAKFENKLYSAASVKRYVDVLNNDAGAIYMTDNATNTTSLFTSVPNVGYTLTNRDLSENQDKDVLPLMGRTGLGDLDISEDGKTLYTVNLAKKELVIIDVATKAITNVPIPNPYNVGAGACPNDEDVRPWALTVKGSDVFIGSVCETGIESGTGAAVQKYSGNAMISTIATTNTLRYLKPKTYNPASATGDYYQNVNWNPSTSWYPHRPALTDIVFDNNGDMILGYTDLGAYARLTGNSSGDIRRMCLQADGSYIDENTGVAPTACDSHTQVYVGNESEVYHEYYVGDFFGSTPSHPGGHPELALGGLAMQPGSSEVAIAAVDATDWYQAGGLSFLDNKTGEKNSAQALVSRDEPERTIYGSKAGGMGDIEILCDAAPIEIGNYVWEDSNSDGIQDPSEPALAGVKVSLFKAGVKVGETTTDAQGHYYFGGVNNNGMTVGNVDPETAYEIRIAKADVGGKSPTTADVNANAEDVRDSDATDNGVDAVIAYTTKSYGENDHTLDFGFAPALGCVEGAILNTTINDPGANITLKLTDKFGKIHTVSSDETDGSFNFSNIPAGTATINVDYTDTDIPEGSTWTAPFDTTKTITVTEGSVCNAQNPEFTTPLPTAFDPKSVASCASPTSATWETATVGSKTVWNDLTQPKTFTTDGGNTVDVTMTVVDDDTQFNFDDGIAGQHYAGTNSVIGSFAGPFLTLYIGKQATKGTVGYTGTDCNTENYQLPQGAGAKLLVEFSESVILDNWRVRDLDSGDNRGSPTVPNLGWAWQDSVKYIGYDKDDNVVPLEAKIGDNSKLIVDANGFAHTDIDNNPADAVGDGVTAGSSTGHIVYTSNGIPIKKIEIIHQAGPDMACQTRSALALAGFAVCKPIHIAGTIYDDGDADRPENGTPINKPACDSEPNGKQLYVQLVDDKGLIIDVTTLAVDGDYYFDKNIKPNANYTVVLTEENKAIGGFASQPSLPSCWNNVGEVDDANPTGALDATIDGIIPVAVAQDSIEELDFGINKKPTANPYEKPVVLNPNGNVKAQLTQDCTVSNFIADKEDGTPGKIKVVSLPPVTSGILYYDGTAVTPNQEIPNVDPCLFSVDPVDGDAVVGFNYVSIDAAGVESDPATVKASFSTLSVSGTLFLDSTIDTTVEGTPTSVACGDASVPLYVSLIGTDGKVLSSKTFDAQDGSYFFNYGDGIKQTTPL